MDILVERCTFFLTLHGGTYLKSPSPSSAVRTLLYAKLDARLAECDLVIDNAEHGRTFHDHDDFLCTKAHDSLQEILLQKLQKNHTPLTNVNRLPYHQHAGI